MSEDIKKRLEIDRKELLDSTWYNPLIYFKLSKSKGVKVIDEKSDFIFKKLVNDGSKMYFADNGKVDGESNESHNVSTPESLEKGYIDNKLQTAETTLILQKRLQKSYLDANTSLQEQGINTLYVSLGVLKWYESESSDLITTSPLVMVPVTLEKGNNSKFSVCYDKADLETNFSLKEKLKSEFGINIPMLNELETTDILTYLDEVENVIKGQHRWKVERDEIYLSFFEFTKLLMYQDLDHTKWPKGKAPSDHPIIQALLSKEEGFQDPQPTYGDSDFLDRKEAVENLIQVLDADGTQVQAMLAVDEGRNIIIQGPPGTGKSQTITNIITNAIGKGKTVLFVAEKAAALDVVKRRLDKVNLGDACLELHAKMANKREVLKELERTLDLGKPQTEKLEAEAKKIETYKGTLNEYCKAVNTPVGNSGLSPHQLIGFLLKQGITNKEIEHNLLNIADLTALGADWLDQALDLAEAIEIWIKSNGTPQNHVFKGANIIVVSRSDKKELEDHALQAIKSLEEFQNFLAIKSKESNVFLPEADDEIPLWRNLFEEVSKSPNLEKVSITNLEWLKDEVAIKNIINNGIKSKELGKVLKAKLHNVAFTENYDEIILEITNHGKKVHRKFINSYQSAIKVVDSWFLGNVDNSNKDRIDILNQLISYKKSLDELTSQNEWIKTYFGNLWVGESSDFELVSNQAQFMFKVHKDGKILPDILNALSANNPEKAKNTIVELDRNLENQNQVWKWLIQKLELGSTIPIEVSEGSLESNFTTRLSLLKKWANNLDDLYSIASWNIIRNNCINANCSFLIEESIVNHQPDYSLQESLKKTWYTHFLDKAYEERQNLQEFDHIVHEDVLEKFRKGDKQVQLFHQAKAASQHYTRYPKRGGGGQLLTLTQEFNKKTRHKPIRKLLEEASTVIQAIKPVFMMSPLSVAKFLAPGCMEFDLVVFDEASQVKPVDAYGAILRGRQLVVVGDSKQLPPTVFFQGSSDDDYIDEDSADYSNTKDIESILGLCKAQGAYSSMLRWHYRSRHESLINVSNHEFYDNKLFVFPSPGKLEI